MTGYGETGPMALFFSFGPLLEAYCGLNAVTGYAGEEPLRLGMAFPDAVGGLHGTFAMLCRRCGSAPPPARRSTPTCRSWRRSPSVAGDGCSWTSVTGERPPRRGNRSLDHAPQGVYRCAGDDAWLADHRHRRRRVAGARRAPRRASLDALADADLAERFAAPRRARRGDRALDRRPRRPRSRRRAAGARHRGVPGVHATATSSTTSTSAARGFMVDVGPARRRAPALPRLPDPLRALAGAHRPRPDPRRAQPRGAHRARVQRRGDRRPRGRRRRARRAAAGLISDGGPTSPCVRRAWRVRARRPRAALRGPGRLHRARPARDIAVCAAHPRAPALRGAPPGIRTQNQWIKSPLLCH